MRVLLITPALPWPLEVFGAAQRTCLLAQALRRIAAVEILHLGTLPAGATHDEERLGAAGVVASFQVPEPRLAGWSRPLAHWPGRVGRFSRLLAEHNGLFADCPEAERWLRDRLAEGRYDLVVTRYVRSLARANPPARLEVPILIDVDDLDSTKFRAQAAHSPWRGLAGAVAMRWIEGTLVRQERRAAAAAAHLWVTHEADARRLGQRPTTWLPNIPFLPAGGFPEYQPTGAAAQALLFVGLLDYGPNRDGLEWFLRHVWPRVRAAAPAARFRIVGARLDEPTRQRWSTHAGVEPVGFVADLRDEYRSAAACVAPIHWGGGTNIKVLEALAHGRTLVAAEHAVRGFPQLRSPHALIAAAAPEDFAAGCLDLLHDHAAREARARHGYELVRAHYSDDSFTRRVLATVAGVLPGIAPDGGVDRPRDDGAADGAPLPASDSVGAAQ